MILKFVDFGTELVGQSFSLCVNGKSDFFSSLFNSDFRVRLRMDQLSLIYIEVRYILMSILYTHFYLLVLVSF